MTHQAEFSVFLLATTYGRFTWFWFWAAAVLLASIPGITGVAWCYWKRRRSLIFGASIYQVARTDTPAGWMGWLYEIASFLPIAAGAVGFVCCLRRIGDASQTLPTSPQTHVQQV